MPPASTSSSSSSSRAALALLATAAGALLAARMARRTRADGLDGRVVIVTGGSRGLGFALARAFAGEGACLVLVARSADRLDAAAERLRAEFRADVATEICDIRDRSAVDAAVSREIDVGVVSRLFATGAAARLNQPIAADELSRRPGASSG
jgi:NAD(P)-dependent dehydrogenase (short-subunit alcohol dehydrogenase family)